MGKYSTKNSLETDQIINSVAEYAKAHITTEDYGLINKFIRLYYAHMALEDIKESTVSDLFGAAISHWHLMSLRKPKELKIDVFNPTLVDHCWHSTHTVIQVVTNDMPFLVDTIRMELNRLGFTIHMIVHIGGIAVRRNKKHEIIDISSFDCDIAKFHREAPIYMQINRQTNLKVLSEIQRNLRRVLRDVRVAYEDWPEMQNQVADTIREMDAKKMKQSAEEVKETNAFLKWILNNHFTFLGFRDYEVVGEEGGKALRLIPHSGLGVLRDHTYSKMLRQFSQLPLEARRVALSEQILIISKTNTLSTVHRPAYTDYIGVKRFNEHGELVGERRFIGLYTSEVYRVDPREIPVIRRKVEQVILKTGLSVKGHAGKDLLHILATLPRDDLFHASVEELYSWSIKILHLQEKREIRLLVRKGIFSRFISCLVYMPRDTFTTNLVIQIQDILLNAFNGLDVSFTTYFGESILARIHFTIRIQSHQNIEYDVDKLEKKLAKIGISWIDIFHAQVLKQFGEEEGNQIFDLFKDSFPLSYQEAFAPTQAIHDVIHIQKLMQSKKLEMSFYRPKNVANNVVRFKLFRPDFTAPLSDALPMLENMGMRVVGEQPYRLIMPNGRKVWVNDFNMTYIQEPSFDIEKVRDIFQEAFEKIWFGEAENDRLNRLVLEAELSWREITLLRAYTKYFRQIGSTFSEKYIANSFINHPKIARLLVDYFESNFDPECTKQSEQAYSKTLEEKISTALDNVAVLDEDRILRQYFALIRATLRTNFYQKQHSGEWKPYLSFKFSSQDIPDMPKPLPKYEIFVYSPHFEGVHLRAGKVARGGIRWSDRPEDYRTEVLGLMKAQQVKNALIVPMGAKGGFYPRSLPTKGTREEVIQEAIRCYQNFIRGLLDLTDNYINGKMMPPDNTVCYDDFDSYLVVAADKGTATFSDIANKIAVERGFWLGDAFASGGSTGYDHKKMGITARGAWVSVENQFLDLGINIKENNFTVVGIGDMSGDVFGNGMLLSKRIKLVAAFNHQHIFIDPNPDPESSYGERERLFKMARSSWDDYNRELISDGGGVYFRSAKSIHLSKEACSALDIKREIIAPNELIKSILRASVDLLWNGGIGTYVKSSIELDNDVGDRSNDNVRVNGKELRARVVGEGGNLGLTQLGRIEFELKGGKINTDFIDNSAGVECSDFEVNIKILLDSIDKSEMSIRKRNLLLARMTNEVSRMVLKDNFLQNKAISLASYLAAKEFDLNRRYLNYLEEHGKIDRALEFLPEDKVLQERRTIGQALTRPEISVLLTYSKLLLKTEIKKSPLLHESYVQEFIKSTFPTPLRKRYHKQMLSHHLCKDILATYLSNQLFSIMGPAFIYQMRNEMVASVPAILRAWLVAMKFFKVEDLMENIYALDYCIDTKVQYQMTAEIAVLLRRVTRWLLRNRRGKIDIAHTIEHFSEYITAIIRRLPKLLLGSSKELLDKKKARYIKRGVPENLAMHIAYINAAFHSLNIIEAATTYHEEVFRVSKIYFMLADRLNLFWFRDRINNYTIDSRWAVLAKAAYKGDLDWIQRELTVRVLLDTKARSIPGKINEWLKKHEAKIARWNDILSHIHDSDQKDFTIFFVAIRELFDIAANIHSDQ